MRFFLAGCGALWVLFLIIAPVKLIALAYLAALAILLELAHQAPTIGEDEEL